MRDPERIDGILETLGKLWKQYPDTRLGQLIEICSPGESVFVIEDNILLAGMLRKLES